MTRSFLVPLRSFLSLSFLFLLLSLAAPFPAWAWPGVVVRVLDGDTLLVAPAGAKDAQVSVRLYGIDAPELKQAGGTASRDALAALLPSGSVVDVVGVNADRYHRAAALVIHKERTLNLEMLKRGHAWVYSQYCRASFCRQWSKAEQAARSDMLGLWSDPAPIPPWQWRKAQDSNP